MESIKIIQKNYTEIIDFFGEKKIEEMYCSYVKMCEHFITREGYDGKVIINRLILAYTIMDFFSDIKRLKSFHDIQNINSIKSVSYGSAWFLRRKPLQIIDKSFDKVYVNEDFVFLMMISFLASESDNKDILCDYKHNPFFDSFVYYLKFRKVNPQTLEIILLAFLSGYKLKNNLPQDARQL